MFEARSHFWWRPAGTAGRPVDAAVFDLLDAVESTGSLFKAASQCGLSYRHAWALMGKWASLLGRPLLVLQRGRGASLTPLATRLLAAQRSAEALMAPQLARLLADLDDAALSDVPLLPRLSIHASHDLALASLRDTLNAGGEVHLDVQFQGSLDSVAALARGACDLAGFHLAMPDQRGDAAASFRHWLKPRSQKLIRFVTREQGLMAAAGNPLAIHGLADLTRKELRLINRQRGSGTRMEFDHLIAAAGIKADSLAGYHTEEFTHLAVAATVAGGLADAGFGIRAAASRFGLHFIPLLREDYFLACRNDALDLAPVQRLIAILAGKPFKAMIASLPGYDAAASGELVEIQRIMPSAPARASARRPRHPDIPVRFRLPES